MTFPLVVLAIFSIAFGWIGIPEKFPLIGGLLPNWLHEFVGGTLLEHPEPVAFSYIPLLTSLVVALGGLFLGWWVYRGYKAGATDPVQKALGPVHTVLKNKYYFDELYAAVFIRPAEWIATVFTYQWMDRTVIDGVLHWFARASVAIGHFLRDFIDKPIVNGFGDWLAESTKKVGGVFRTIQTGRVQQYMILALVSIAAFSVLFYYLLAAR
jgi:NADH-quinone oxidoreductase subunit L